MRMCKWNKFRGNNSTTISFQSADTRERILRRLCDGPQDPNDDPRFIGISADWCGFGPILPQIYSVLLPFWYINFYSIWFADIAMVIGWKEMRAQLSLSLSLPLLFFSRCRFLDILPLASPFSRSTITRKEHFAAHSKCAIMAQLATLLERRLCYAY